MRPDVRAFLDYLAEAGYPAIETQRPQDARASMIASKDLVDLPMGELETATRLAIPSPDGDIPAMLLDPRASRPAGPVVLWFHGGGFVTGGILTHQSLCAEVARQLDLPVVLLDYRLAPEAPFPAAPVDAQIAARWLASSPPELQRDVTGLVLAGDSSGGTLAIATAITLRDAPADVPVLAQLVIYPAVDESKVYPSAEQFATGHLLTKAGRNWYRDHYRPDRTDLRASPLLADLHDLPPAVVVTAGLDIVRDQGRAYAAALITAGVPTTFREAKGNIHAFLLLRRAIPSTQLDVSQAISALQAVIDQPANAPTK